MCIWALLLVFFFWCSFCKVIVNLTGDLPKAGEERVWVPVPHPCQSPDRRLREARVSWEWQWVRAGTPGVCAGARLWLLLTFSWAWPIWGASDLWLQQSNSRPESVLQLCCGCVGQPCVKNAGLHLCATQSRLGIHFFFLMSYPQPWAAVTANSIPVSYSKYCVTALRDWAYRWVFWGRKEKAA